MVLFEENKRTGWSWLAVTSITPQLNGNRSCKALLPNDLSVIITILAPAVITIDEYLALFWLRRYLSHSRTPPIGTAFLFSDPTTPQQQQSTNTVDCSCFSATFTRNDELACFDKNVIGFPTQLH